MGAAFSDLLLRGEFVCPACGARQALLQYELSAKIKRADVQALLDHLTAWRVGLWIQDGVLDADIRDIRWTWIPNGIGWIDPLKEIDAWLAPFRKLWNAHVDTFERHLDRVAHGQTQRKGKDKDR